MVGVSLYDAANQAREAANFDFWPITDEEHHAYNFIVADDVAETLRTYAAMRERLMAYGAEVALTTLVDKPVKKRVPDLHPDFAPLFARPDEWLIGEGMNSGDTPAGQAMRSLKGVWVLDS